MIEKLASFILEKGFSALFPPKTKLATFKKFLDKKSKQAERLSKKKKLDADQIIGWHNQLSRGFVIALGSDIKNADIKLNRDIIESRMDGLKFYGATQSRVELARILSECGGFISLIKRNVSPDTLSPQYEPADLKEYE